MESTLNEKPYRTSQLLGLILGLGFFFTILALPAPEAIGDKGWSVFAVIGLMLTWWVAESVPIPVTALTPIITFPLLDLMPIKQVTSTYGHPIVFLFLGGFLIAVAMQKWQLHIRIALYIVRLTGTKATGILGGFMIATAFLSMWVSNTATTIMMLPIALSVLELLKNKCPKQHARFAIAMLLSIAFSANIGGTATIIGTPPNAILAGFLGDKFGFEVTFLKWFMVGMPFMLIMLFLLWRAMIFFFKLNELGKIEGSEQVIAHKWEMLGKIGRQEKLTFIVFVATAASWMFKGAFPFEITDTAIAMIGGLSLFFIPINLKKSEFLLSWEDSKDLPWGILLLAGGGLNLAAAMSDSGIVVTLGEHLTLFHEYGFFFLALVILIAVVFMTESMSNMALLSVMLPVIVAISLQLDLNPLVLTVAAALASSCAFMLPMATPPNAIVFSSGHIRIVDMVKVGIWLNFIAIGVVMLLIYTLIPAVFSESLTLVTLPQG